ncbi:MAG TPA: hypothetical protein VK998_01760 [Schnuerera sp.]|nr:hypothetical protein [Schnuerera sp.]HSH34965.1 hypothetical protein [Schnuerera sp.]
MSTEVGVLPPDYVAGTGLAFGEYEVEEGVWQRVRWDFDLDQWVDVGAPKPSIGAIETFASKKVNTIADLKSEPGFFESLFTSTPAREILGFYEVGDGGGGTFYWDVSESKANHNGGTIINPKHNSVIGSENWYEATVYPFFAAMDKNQSI